MSKECIYCRSEIHDKAIKCKECDGFQNWRKHLNFSSTILSLLIALISVLTVAIPAIVSALEKENAEIAFKVLEAPKFTAMAQGYGNSKTGESFSTIKYSVNFPVVIANSGNKPGFLYSLVVKVKDGEGVLDFFVGDQNKIEAESIITKKMSLGLTMDKYDKLFNAWKVPKIDGTKDIEEDFGKVIISLMAMSKSGDIYEVKNFNYEIGKISITAR